MKTLKLALPKGSLNAKTLELFKQAGYDIKAAERSYRPWVNDKEIELKLIRPQEIPTLVEQGIYDLGISGTDWINETTAKVITLADLEYGKVKIVLAIPNEWKNINSLNELILDLNKKNKPLRISTEYINLSLKTLTQSTAYKQLYGEKKPEVITPWYRFGDNPAVKIILSFGATEAKPPSYAEAIIDNTETGTTIKRNNLKIIEVITESSAILFASKDAMNDSWKKEKIKDVTMLLKSAVDARKKLHIFVNVQKKNLEKLLSILPSLKKPTISKLAGSEDWYSLNTVIPREYFMKIVPILRKYAQGLVVHVPRQVLPLEEFKS
ncbi:MAG: ATP phosphoribosyltransferase [Candidatus Odinarchaeia archaeon]